jgi:hypothetical protein
VKFVMLEIQEKVGGKPEVYEVARFESEKMMLVFKEHLIGANWVLLHRQPSGKYRWLESPSMAQRSGASWMRYFRENWS